MNKPTCPVHNAPFNKELRIFECGCDPRKFYINAEPALRQVVYEEKKPAFVNFDFGAVEKPKEKILVN